MGNNIINLPPFSTQTWRKQSGQTIQDFRNSVNDNVKNLIERGYNVEVEWLNSNGESCDDERDVYCSTVCRIVERKKELRNSNGVAKDSGNADWVAEQRAIIDNMRKNQKDEI